MTVKNKTLVINLPHVKWDQIPPLKGTIKNSENINGRYGQSSTKRRD
jgi:hypothetical protein